jgi:hypothetical protein
VTFLVESGIFLNPVQVRRFSPNAVMLETNQVAYLFDSPSSKVEASRTFELKEAATQTSRTVGHSFSWSRKFSFRKCTESKDAVQGRRET